MSFLLPFALMFVSLVIAEPAHASRFGAILEGPAGGWLLFACALLGLYLFAGLCRQGSKYLAEQTHASQVARLMDLLANQADGIAGVLLSHPPASTDTLQIVREAAIAQSIAYAKMHLPDTIAQVGASDAIMAVRLANFVAQKTMGAASTAVVLTGSDPVGDLTRAALVGVLPQPAALPAA